MKSPGWENRLIAYLAAVRAQPYQSAQLDSGMFPAGAVAAMTGVDHVKAYRGKYKTAARGKAMLRNKGFADYVEFVASKFEEHKSPLMAQRGDLVAIEQDGVAVLGIVQGEHIYVMTPAGLGMVPLTRAKRAFKI
jgi:hypothetical protein